MGPLRWFLADMSDALEPCFIVAGEGLNWYPGYLRMTAATEQADLTRLIESCGQFHSAENVELELTGRTRFPLEYQGFGEYALPIEVLDLSIVWPAEGSAGDSPSARNQKKGPARHQKLKFSKGLRLMLRVQAPDSNRKLMRALRTRYGIT
jgi:hypothetical protein